MATSRTGTAKWKNLRRYAIREARNGGLIACPICRTPLDYTAPRRPNSAEVDHIIPASCGGQDAPDNVRVICRLCNQSRGNRVAPTASGPRAVDPLPLSRRW